MRNSLPSRLHSAAMLLRYGASSAKIASRAGRWHVAVLAVLGVAASENVWAITAVRLKTFDLVLEDGSRPDGLRSFGRLTAYLAALKRAGHGCKLSTYEYGGLVDCQTRAGQRVLIGIDAIPTRAPDLAQVSEIRPDGVNSKPVPANERATFLLGLIDRPGAAPR